MKITLEQLQKIVTADKAAKLINDLNDCLEKYEINTKLRICHFLAQVLHESAGFVYLKENLNYSKEGLVKVFGKYFTPDMAAKYERNPIKIANRVYANRMGNSTEESGEPALYIGRGFIQLTGKQNYTYISEDLKVDFIHNPDLLATEKYGILSAGWFWNKNKLNGFADLDDIMTITKRINGGTLGLLDRKEWLNKTKAVFI